MDLKDLFVSHKQVQAPVVQIEKPVLPQPLYLNLDRAQKAVVSTLPSEKPESGVDMGSWVVGGSGNSRYGWVVKTAPKTTNAQNQQPSTTKSTPTSSSNETATKVSGTTSGGAKFDIVKNGNKVISWTNPYVNNSEAWINDMIAAYQRLGISTNGIKNLMAKNIIESGYGRSAQGSFNFGNITTGSQWEGAYFAGRDTDSAGNRIANKFRCYNSIDEFVKDEVQFLTKLYGFDQNDTIDEFLRKLQEGFKESRRYADSNNYVKDVKNVYNKITWNG